MDWTDDMEALLKRIEEESERNEAEHFLSLQSRASDRGLSVVMFLLKGDQGCQS